MKLCDSQKHFIPNLSKPVTAAYTGETENSNFDFCGLTYERRTKCWSLRLDISSRRRYLCTYTYAIMIFFWGEEEGLQNKIINQSNKNDEAFVCSFNAICIIFSRLTANIKEDRTGIISFRDIQSKMGKRISPVVLGRLMVKLYPEVQSK